jgi:hypothetical protein
MVRPAVDRLGSELLRNSLNNPLNERGWLGSQWPPEEEKE